MYPLVPSVFGRQQNFISSNLKMRFSSQVVTEKTHQNEYPCKVCEVFQLPKRNVWKPFSTYRSYSTKNRRQPTENRSTKRIHPKNYSGTKVQHIQVPCVSVSSRFVSCCLPSRKKVTSSASRNLFSVRPMK